MGLISTIIPSYKDPALNKTILSIMQGALLTETQIVVVLDGYRPKDYVEQVQYVFLGQNRGMRGAINAGVSVSDSRYILVIDEHCMVPPGFLLSMVNHCPEKGIITAQRFSLDPVKWEAMPGPPIGYEKMIIHEGRFVGVRWRSRDRKYQNRLIDENMAMQGSCYMMRRDWWDKIGILQEEGYGSFAQEAPEVLFKTWQAGGKLLLNKTTWYAHKHRSFRRTKHIGAAITSPGNAYALATWKDFYEKEILPLWK